MTSDPPRRLIYVPVIHTAAELGSHQQQVRSAHIARYGPDQWARHVRTVDDFWSRLREWVLGLRLEYAKVKLYQDGLPVCERELEIVRELAEGGSRNHQLLTELVERGAALVGTESLSLLLEERRRWLAEDASHPRARGEGHPLYDELLERRDEYVSRRVAETLGPGEVGILFIGALHRIVERLPADIEVETPDAGHFRHVEK